MTFVPQFTDRVIVWDTGGGVWRWKRTRADGTTVLTTSSASWPNALLAAEQAAIDNKEDEQTPGPSVEVI